jgi:hypothetical protein
MKLFFIPFLLLLIGLPNCFCVAQTLTKLELDQALDLRVKHIEEFMARFNYQQDIDNKPIIQPDTAKRRLFMINLLADASKLSWTQKKLSNEFINSVIAKQQLLNYNDKDWYVQATCEVKYRKKKLTMKITLQNEYLNKSNAWVIVGVDTAFSDVVYSKKTTKAFLPSSSVEVSFMALKQKTKDTVYTSSYFDNNFKPDALTAFFMAWQSGDLVIAEVSALEIHFLQLRGYTFCVKKVESLLDTKQKITKSGWLITDIKALDALSLPVYKSFYLFLKL